MKVVNMGNISDAFRFDNLPATGIVIDATPEELKLLPNLAYKDVTISEHVGNAANIHEALHKLLNFLRWEYAQDYPVSRDKLADAIDIGVSALATPPRNCDIGNALEQVSRHRIWCKCGGACAVSCKMCFAKWSQMPYEEGGAK